MAFESYWIGKGINLDELWEEFEQGGGYISKFKTINPYLLRLSFENHPIELPLFDHEVIYKTVKGTFHDVKLECFSREKYNRAAPIFLYRIDRGSGIFEFLAQLDPLLTYAAALGSAYFWYKMLSVKDVELSEKKWKFIRSKFLGASDDDILAYMKAWTNWGRNRVLHRMIEQGLHRVEISKHPVTKEALPEDEMVDMIELFEAQRDEDI